MNTFKTTILLTALTLLLVGVGGAVGGKTGASIMLIISLAMNFGSYWFSDKIVLSMYNAQPVNENQAPDLYNMVKKLTQNAKMPMPRVYVINTEMPNAFATGRNPENGVVAVTTGIMKALNYDELEGVVAHELAHIKNRDTLISTIVASIAGVISWIGTMAQWAAILGTGRSDEEDNGGGIAGLLFTIIVAPLAATLIQMAISRSREFEADEDGGTICGNPLALASAVKKIEHYSKYGVMQEATPATAHMFIINPLSGSGRAIMNLFSTHPTTAKRVEKLEDLARRR